MTVIKLEESDALLIVDVQHDFLPGGALGVPDGHQVVPLLAALAELFESKGLTVVASRDWHPPDHCSFRQSGGPWPPHCQAGTPGAELDRGLGLSGRAVIVDKATTVEADAYSAFDGTHLDDMLSRKGIKRLFIGGLATDYCVLSTARDAVANGYAVVLLEDAIRAIDPDDGRRAIDELRDMHVEVIDSRNVLDAEI